MVVVFQEIWMLKVPEVKEHAQHQAQREDRLEDSPEPSLEQLVRHTKESEFLRHHMTKKVITHAGCVEGNIS